MLTYHMTIAGVERDLPICPLTDTLSIGAFVIFGDVELTVACARELLKIAPEYDYMITAESKGIPLVYEMARQAGAKKWMLARKGVKLYMKDVLGVEVGDSVAVVNLSGGFYSRCQMLDSAAERRLIYAMVNALTELEGIGAVRFIVEGVSIDTLVQSIYLRTPLLPDPGIVRDEDGAPTEN